MPSAALAYFADVLKQPEHEKAWKAFQREIARRLVADIAWEREALHLQAATLQDLRTKLEDAAREAVDQIHDAIADEGQRTREAVREVGEAVRGLQSRVAAVGSLPASPASVRGALPAAPSMFVGRDTDLAHIRTGLGRLAGDGGAATVGRLYSVLGWPGVGKSTLTVALAHDAAVRSLFPDGVVWGVVGQEPDLGGVLSHWAAVVSGDPPTSRVGQDAAARLRALLSGRSVLLIADDVWESSHVETLLSATPRGCVLLVTSRENKAVEPFDAPLYRVPPLDDAGAVELLRRVISDIIERHPVECLEMARELERLPLSLLVAARLLKQEADRGFGVLDLLRELRDGVRVVKAKAPMDRFDVKNQTLPTVASLLELSTNRLSERVKRCFASLGVMKPKPATFDIEVLEEMWREVFGLHDPRPIVRELHDRGLLESISEGLYHLHALLVAHAVDLQTRVVP